MQGTCASVLLVVSAALVARDRWQMIMIITRGRLQARRKAPKR